jgi:hypothetical protein
MVIEVGQSDTSEWSETDSDTESAQVISVSNQSLITKRACPNCPFDVNNVNLISRTAHLEGDGNIASVLRFIIIQEVSHI